MSKLLKKDLLREDNSYQISQQKASIDSLITTYGTTQHSREITATNFVPQQLVTVAANNVYWQNTWITFGATSKTAGSACVYFFKLPNDYVDGTDVVIKLFWSDSVAANVVDYLIFGDYYRDSLIFTQFDLENLTWTSEGISEANLETITFDGTNLLKNDGIRISLRMEDDDNTHTIFLISLSLITQVDGRD